MKNHVMESCTAKCIDAPGSKAENVSDLVLETWASSTFPLIKAKKKFAIVVQFWNAVLFELVDSTLDLVNALMALP